MFPVFYSHRSFHSASFVIQSESVHIGKMMLQPGQGKVLMCSLFDIIASSAVSFMLTVTRDVTITNRFCMLNLVCLLLFIRYNNIILIVCCKPCYFTGQKNHWCWWLGICQWHGYGKQHVTIREWQITTAYQSFARHHWNFEG